MCATSICSSLVERSKAKNVKRGKKKKKLTCYFSRQKKSDSFKIALVLAQFFFLFFSVLVFFFSVEIASDVGDDVIGFTNSGKGPNEQQKTPGPNTKLLKRSDRRFVQMEDVIHNWLESIVLWWCKSKSADVNLLSLAACFLFKDSLNPTTLLRCTMLVLIDTNELS